MEQKMTYEELQNEYQKVKTELVESKATIENLQLELNNLKRIVFGTR